MRLTMIPPKTRGIMKDSSTYRRHGRKSEANNRRANSHAGREKGAAQIGEKYFLSGGHKA